MPGHPTPAAAAARFGGVTSRRHAELLLHSGVDGAAVSVKDLRLRRVVPPAAGSLDTSSPECVAPVKPGSVQSTPPEAVSAAAAAAAAAGGNLDRKLVPPRSKLVRDPRSFGYRRLLPFLNEMTKNDSSIGKEVSPQDTAAQSKDGLDGSDSRLADGSVGVSHLEPEAMDSMELVVVNTGGDADVKDACNNVTEEIKTVVPHDLTNKPLLARCTRSRFVHHPSSFSYKRMLPFLMENEISAQESDRIKIRKVADERQPESNENDASASGQKCLVSDDSSQECNRGQAEIMKEEKPSKADENHVLDDRQLQPPVLEVSPPDCSAVEVQNVMQQEALASSQSPLTSFEGELTSDGDNVQAVGQLQLVVSEESPEESKRDEVKRSIHDEAVKSDAGYALDSKGFQLVASDVSSENSMAEVQGAAQEEPLPLDGVEENSDKGDYVSKEEAQLCVTNESLAAQLQDNAEFAEVLQCQNLDSGCHDVGFGSPTKRVIPLLHRHCAQPQDSVVSLDDQLHDDIQMVCRPSDPCAVDRSLSMEEMSGSPSNIWITPFTESPSSKAGISRPSDAYSTGKRTPSPKKLSPRKGILKRSTRGCKGICMCLDCSMFRLRADRAFEFSKKQMKEADDIISNLLKEVASLRSLLEKPAGQPESTQAACRQASRVEEVARSRCQQMFVDLNSHCRIPGPRVRFADYVEEKKAAPSPRRSSRR